MKTREVANWRFRDVVAWLQRLGREGRRADLAICAPPHAVGAGGWFPAVVNALRPDGSLYLATNNEHAAHYGLAIEAAGLTVRNWIKWRVDLGLVCAGAFNRAHVNIFYCVRDPKRFTFNRDAIRVPSARQARYNDRRANPAGKLPDDVWSLPPDEGGPLGPDGSCRLSEPVLERIIKASSNEGGLILDPFPAGGATLAVAGKLGRRAAALTAGRG